MFSQEYEKLERKLSIKHQNNCKKFKHLKQYTIISLKTLT